MIHYNYITVAPCLQCLHWQPGAAIDIGTVCRVCGTTTYGATPVVIHVDDTHAPEYPDVERPHEFAQLGKRPMRAIRNVGDYGRRFYQW